MGSPTPIHGGHTIAPVHTHIPGQPHDVRLTLHHRGRAAEIDWRDIGSLDWTSFGLVCGGGGSTGASFEAGVLLALELDHHVDLSAARSVVGTSAGAIVGSLIALGFGGH